MAVLFIIHALLHKNGTFHLCILYYAKVDILIEETNVSVAKVCLVRCKGVLKCCSVLFFLLFDGRFFTNCHFFAYRC